MTGVLEPHLATLNDEGLLLQPFGPIIYKTSVSTEVLKSLDELADMTRYDSSAMCNDTLAGNMKNEKRISTYIEDKTYVHVKDQIFKRVAETYCAFINQPTEIYGHFAKKMKMSDVWINFQQTFEWNPLHHHSGDYSFVIYLQNDIDMDIERQHQTQQGNSPTAGKISFHYGENVPMMNNVLSILPERGDMFVFPASLNHQVAPFTEEGKERISVAGNVFLPEIMPNIGTGENIL